jgi:rubrerythrin
MSKLSGSKTHQNLKDAFAGESQATGVLCTSHVARTSSYPDIGGVPGHLGGRDRARVEHLDFLKEVGDPRPVRPSATPIAT